MAATCGNCCLRVTMDAAEYFIDSAKSAMDTFDDIAALVSWSPTTLAAF